MKILLCLLCFLLLGCAAKHPGVIIQMPLTQQEQKQALLQERAYGKIIDSEILDFETEEPIPVKIIN